MNKSAHDAVATAKERCWKEGWVIDLDIEKFYDNIPHDLLMKAVKRHCTSKWMLLYIERWLKADVQTTGAETITRTRGVPPRLSDWSCACKLVPALLYRCMVDQEISIREVRTVYG